MCMIQARAPCRPRAKVSYGTAIYFLQLGLSILHLAMKLYSEIINAHQYVLEINKEACHKYYET